MDELVTPVPVDFSKEFLKTAKSTAENGVAHGCTRKKEPAGKAGS